MNAAGYTLHIDADQHLGECQLWGFWDLPLQETFEDQFEAMLRQISPAHAGFGLLVDASAWPAQMPVVVQRCGHLLRLAVTWGLARGAIVHGHHILTGFQLRRLTARVDPQRFAHFSDRRQAERWLRQPA